MSGAKFTGHKHITNGQRVGMMDIAKPKLYPKKGLWCTETVHHTTHIIAGMLLLRMTSRIYEYTVH